MKHEYPGEIIYFSSITGAIAAFVKSFVHHIFEWTGAGIHFYNDINSYLIHGHKHPAEFVDKIFAEFGDMALGAIFGVILGVWLSYSRPKYHWGIGVGFGFGIWFMSLVFGNLTKIIKDTQTTHWTLFAHLLAMVTYGLLFVLATRFWKPLKERVIMESWKKS